MNTFAIALQEDRRLVILRFLEGAAKYALNDSLLQTALETLGHIVSRDTVRSDIAWLAEQGLVTVDHSLIEVHVARLTARGKDVATGRADVPGVKRPGPSPIPSP
ncbi:MAG: ArsR family transcriptional regulator [Alphaproteobacteria bacterium]